MRIPSFARKSEFWIISGLIVVLILVCYIQQNQKEKSYSDYTCEEIEINIVNSQGSERATWQAMYTSNGCYVYK